MGLLDRPRPHRHGTETVVAPLPAERLRLGQRAGNQQAGLLGAGSGLIRVGPVGQKLVRRSAQKQNHQTAAAELVEHGDLFGNPDRIVHRHQRSQHGDLGPTHDLTQGGGKHGRVGRLKQRRIVVFRATDPVKAEFVGQFGLGQGQPERLLADLRAEQSRRGWPALVFEGFWRKIAISAKERRLHKSVLPNTSTGSYTTRLVNVSRRRVKPYANPFPGRFELV